jgi:MFS family permease
VTAVPGRLAASWRSGPLAVRSFRLLAGGQFASTIGDFCYAVALPWLVLSEHGGAILLGIVLACYGVPRTVLIPVGGVLADKVGPCTLMLAADAARCALVAVLALLAARHTASLAALGPIAALIGAGEGLFIPASFAIMPSLLDGERLAAGNALSTAAVQVGSLLGPALGGALVAVTHASTAAFAVDAASFGVSALTLLLIPREPAIDSAAGEAAAAVPATGEPTDQGGVLALLKRSRELQVILVVVIAANLASGGMGDVALPSLAHASFGAAGYGALLACFAIGGVVGTLGAARTCHLPPATCHLPPAGADHVRLGGIPDRGGGDGPDPLPGRRGGRRGRALRGRRLQRPGQRHRADRPAEICLPRATRPGDGNADALLVRQLPAVGGGFRGAGPPPRAYAVLPGGGGPGRGGHPGRADAAGVPDVRGPRSSSGRGSR